ncbi:phage major capsid protein [Bradyrhizobium yuanmingense]|uniref:phage major capsid protein n=1 Tax=Bradyrhizobium yuanmingense TaxID=108015 RepID=UPI0004B1E17D|nr:phage major capsid protein [Bradyrhizobium yuanmingense]
MVRKAEDLLRLIQADGLVTRSAPDAAQRLKEIQKRAVDGVIHRAAEVVSINEEARTVELAFSSEAPVVRWWGEETLSHDPSHIRLGRLSDGAALLWNHDWDDQRGVVESVRIDSDRKGRAVVRFSTSPKGEELWQDVKNKIKRHVSVGYFIHAMQLVEVVDDFERWLITDWEPYEISIVSVPADTSVGIGRSAAEIAEVERNAQAAETGTLSNSNAPNPVTRTDTTMEKILRNAAGDLVRAKVDDNGNIIETLEVIERAGDGQRQMQQQGQANERARVAEINALVKRFARGVPNGRELADAAIAEGRSVAEFQQTMLDAVDKRMATPLPEQNAEAGIGLTERQVSEYSIMRVARSLADPGNRTLREAAAMEFEASEAAIEALGRSGERFVVPPEVLSRAVGTALSRAAMSTNVTGPMNAGQVVNTSLETGSFIDLLRNNTVALRLGRVLGGLVGNVDIPKKIAGGTGYWIGEGQDAQETGMSLGQLSFKPKTVAAYADVTHRALMQSSMDVEALLRADLAESLGLTIDTAAWYGTGTEFQPLGILNHTGINAVPFAGDYPTWDEIVAMETAVAVDNALATGMKFVAAPGFRGHAKTTLKFEAAGSATLWEPGNTVNGYPVEITNQVKAGDVPFGNFNDFIIAMWGGLEIDVDTAALKKSRGLRVLAFQDIDFGLRRLESFVLGKKA